MAFDIEKARQDGWESDEIVDYLHKHYYPDFDVAGARSNYSDDEIAKFLSTGEGYDTTPGSPAVAAFNTVGRGINTAAAQILGIPGDLGDWVSGGQGPIPTSREIKQGMNLASEAITGNRMAYEDITDLPPGQRPFGVGGEVVPASALLAAAPLSAAARGHTAKGTILEPLLETAAKHPGKFAMAESAATGGAGSGAGAAEALFPGNETARFIGEVTGATFHPVALGSKYVGRGLKNAFESITTAGKQRRAGRYLSKLFEESGENPDEVIAALRAAEALPEVGGTVGQRTGSPTVLALENFLGKQSSKYATTRRADGEDAVKLLDEAVFKLEQSGNPEDLAQAVKLRARSFDVAQKEILDVAEQEAKDAIAGLSRGADPERASRDAYNSLHEALDASNKIVSAAWQRVPTGTPATPASFLQSVHTVRNEKLLPSEKLPDAIEGMVEQYIEEPATTARELNRLRSRLLEFGRTARSNNEFGNAAIYNDLANGVLDDLVRVQGPEAAEARAATARLHENFTNTFANLGLKAPTTGGRALTPAEMLNAAFGSGGVVGREQVGELRRAASAFPIGRDIPANMEGSLMDYARGSAARDLTDPLTGAINPRQTTARANQQVMQDMPTVQQDLLTAATAQQRLDTVSARPQRSTQALDPSSPFALMLRGGDPVEAVTTALNKGPAHFRSLANAATKSGDTATAGLRSATIESLYQKAGGSFSKLDLLLKPSSRGKPSTLDIMQSRGIMDEAQADRMREIVRRGVLVEQAAKSQNMIDKAVSPPDAISDALTSIVGANIGGSLGGSATGAPLVAAGLGAKAARTIASKGPQTKITEALELITRDPKLFEAAIAQGPARKEAVTRLNAAMIQAGLDPIFEDENP